MNSRNLILLCSIGLLLAACVGGSDSASSSDVGATSSSTVQSSSSSDLTTLTNSLTGVGKEGTPGYAGTVPYICLQDANGNITGAVASGQAIASLSQYSGNLYYAGATIRMGGCDASTDTYLGYIGFNLNPTSGVVSLGSFQAATGIHMVYTPSLTNNILSGVTEFTPIESNLSSTAGLKPISTTLKLPFVGVNLSGLEFSTVINTASVPDLSEVDAGTSNSDLATMQAFVSAGVNTVRVPINWAFLALGGESDATLNLSYWNNFVKPLLETLSTNKVYTILDLHNYMHYSWMGLNIAGCGASSQCPDGILDTNSSDFANIWQNIYAAIKQDPAINQNYLMFDLMNEPAAASGENLTPTQVYSVEIPVAKALQNSGFTGYILLEGDSWTGLHSWTTQYYSDGQTNAMMFSESNLQGAGLNLNTVLINVHQYFDSDFSGTQGTCQTDLTTVGSNGFNLDAFADYLSQNHLKAMVTEFGGANSVVGGQTTCQPAIESFVSYLSKNATTLDSSTGGFVGATMWGAGHGWGGNSYVLYISPSAYQFTTMMSGLMAN